jgi:hypothetical protein
MSTGRLWQQQRCIGGAGVRLGGDVQGGAEAAGGERHRGRRQGGQAVAGSSGSSPQRCLPGRRGGRGTKVRPGDQIPVL